MTTQCTSPNKAPLICLHCAAPIQAEESVMSCRGCQKHWPVINHVPILVENPALYGRYTLARNEIAKSKTFLPFSQSFEKARSRVTELDQDQTTSLLNVVKATQENYELFDNLLQPLQTLFPQNKPFEVEDLDPQKGGYGPPATLEYLLRDWREDSQEGLTLANLHLPTQKRERAVILGSGAGRALVQVAEQAAEVIGIDLSYLLAHASNRIFQGERLKLNEVRIKNVRRISDRVITHGLGDGHSRSNIRTLIADATRCPLPDACADFVVAAFLFDLMTDGRILLKEMRRLLRPDGQAILLTVFGYEQENLWTYYTPDQVIELLKIHELQVDDVSWFKHSHLNSPYSILNYQYEAVRIIMKG